MRGIAGAWLAFILVLPSLAIQAPASSVPGQVSPRIEWSMDFASNPGTPYPNFTDLDGDGSVEMAIYANYVYTLFDTPSYNVLLTLDDPTIKDYQYIRFGNATAMDILITYQTNLHFNVSVISGKDFKETWRSPDIEGTLCEKAVRDIDADDQPEFVWATFDGTTTCYHVFDAISHEPEWSSAPILHAKPYESGWLQNVDDDPALEILVSGATCDYFGANPISAYDGATHEMQWTISMPDPFHFEPWAYSLTDINNDSEYEFILPYISKGETGNTTCGLNVYCGRTGAFEWGIGPWPGDLHVASMADINGDGWMEILMDVTIWNVDVTRTLIIFGPKENRTLWTAGPLSSSTDGSWNFRTDDLDGDGTPDVMLSKVMDHGGTDWTGIFGVLRGTDFMERWISPEVFLYFTDIEKYQPTEGSPTMILLNYGNGPRKIPHTSTLEILSSTDFLVLFKGIYPGNLTITVDDWNGDGTPELLLVHSDYELLDGNDFHRIWKASWNESLYPNTLAADFCDGPLYEILRLSHFTENKKNNGTGSNSWNTSTISIYDSQTLAKIWSSQRLDGSYSVLDAADIDNDTNIEALFRVEHNGPDIKSLVIIEFSKDAPWTPGFNLHPPTVTIEQPQNGQNVSGTVQISGSAEDDNNLAQVMVRIDDGEWINTTWTLGAGNLTCSWNRSWDSSREAKGSHRISARAFDGVNWSSEVSVTVELLPPGTTTPGRPVPMIGTLSDPACIVLMVVALTVLVGMLIIRKSGT